MTAVVGGALVAIGVLLTVLAAIGAVKLPDALIRLNAATKAATLGVAFVLGGAAVLNPSPVTVIKLLAAIVLQFLTAPVTGHILGRSAYRAGVPLWPGTRYDQLAAAVRAEQQTVPRPDDASWTPHRKPPQPSTRPPVGDPVRDVRDC